MPHPPASQPRLVVRWVVLTAVPVLCMGCCCWCWWCSADDDLSLTPYNKRNALSKGALAVGKGLT